MICNERYASIYGAPSELTKPVAAHASIVGYRSNGMSMQAMGAEGFAPPPRYEGLLRHLGSSELGRWTTIGWRAPLPLLARAAIRRIPIDVPDALTPAFVARCVKRRQSDSFAGDVAINPGSLADVNEQLATFLMPHAAKARSRQSDQKDN